jgi:hypothetical protein
MNRRIAAPQRYLRSSAFIGGQICFSSGNAKTKTRYWPPMNADERG